MLSRVVVQSENPFYLEIENAKPDDSIILDRIEGLDPPDIDLFVGDYARDGGFYSGRRVGKRNPVFYFTLNPNYSQGETVSGLRELLYRAFIDPLVVGDAVRVELQDTSRPTRYFTGYAEKIESAIFAKETEMVVSMLCPNPYLYDTTESIVNSGGASTVPFEYSGTAETGLEIKVDMSAGSDALTLQLNDIWFMTLNYTFLGGDTVYINTRRGERKIEATRDGVTTDIYYTLSAESRWLELHRLATTELNPTGENTLKVYGETPADTVANIRQIKSRAAWWAI